MTLLGIETATSICSVALFRDGKLLSLRQSSGTNQHSAILTNFIAEVFSEAHLAYHEMDAVAVSMGPGSYTGLRIGVSTAKGLCYALNKPFIAIDTLKTLAYQALQQAFLQDLDLSNTLLCPMLDARRMEVYTALFDQQLQLVQPVNALVVTPEAFAAFAPRQILYFGDGAAKCTTVLGLLPHFTHLQHISLTAEAVCHLAETEYHNHHFADVAYCEPFYLKDFIAGKPHVKGLH